MPGCVTLGKDDKQHAERQMRDLNVTQRQSTTEKRLEKNAHIVT